MKIAFASIALAAVLAGCGSRAAAPLPMMPAPSQQSGVVTIGFDDNRLTTFTGATVGIRLNGENPFTSPKYGVVLGYFKGLISTTSQVITLKHGINVRFKNVDSSFPHTFSFLGNATKNNAPWPKTFDGSGTKSKAGTAIGTKNFSTGPLSPGQLSSIYTTGVPGFYMVGCAFHYDSHGMRTVIIVQ